MQIRADLDQDRVAFVGPDGATRFGALAIAQQRGLVAGHLSGKRVAVLGTRPWFACHAIAISIAVADALILCPPDLGGDDLNAFLRVSRAEVLVTDSASLLRELTHPEILLSYADSVPRLLETGTKPADGYPRAEIEWLLATSGTTGVPKLVSHHTSELTRTSSRAITSEGVVWALTYQVTRFAGLQVCLQSLLSGSTLAIPSSEGSPQEQLRTFADFGCTHFSATPSFWRRALMTDAAMALRPQQITLGGEIADQRILDHLADAFPGARIAHIYATTETGTVFSVTDGRAGFPASFLVDGVRDARLATSAEGTLLVSIRSNPSVDTGDLIEAEGDRIYFRGRASGTINVGGTKIAPEQVEEALRLVDGVMAAAVRSRPSSILGNTIEATVVQRDDVATTDERARQIRLECSRHLPREAVPSIVLFADALDVDATGKQARRHR